MGQTTIEWTATPNPDGSWTPGYTFNPWWGCAQISPGCDNCYAKAMDKRFGGNHWGPRARYKTMAPAYWAKPLRWDLDALREGRRRRVFCASMTDVFDLNGPEPERARLWALIRQTPGLDWLLLTKRPGNIERLLPEDWGAGFSNVWIGATVENRKHGLRRIETLRRISAAIRFLSCEPLLEDLGELDLSGIDWVIAGGESGPRFRPMDPAWIERIYVQCRAANIPFFFKQWGGRSPKVGGCHLNGTEIKEFPCRTFFANRLVGEFDVRLG